MLGLIILAACGAVALFTMVILDLVGRALHEYEQGHLERGTRSLGEMFIFVERRQLLLLTLAISITLCTIGWLLFNWFVGLVLLLVGFLSPSLVINRLRLRRIREFDRQLVDALAQMASALRAGLTFVQAAENISQEAPPPLGEEFTLVVREVKLGVSQEDALKNLANRLASDSLALVVTATNISKQLGGNLAEIYDVIAQTVRDRFQIEGRVQALTAMGRMQAWVVGAMPVLMGLALNFMRPDLMEPMLASSFGKALVLAVVLMEATGIWLIRRMVDIEV